MRKTSVYVKTLLTALTISALSPAAVYAASGSYHIPGGKMVVIGGTGSFGCNGTLPELDGINLAEFICSNLPDWQCPDITVPGQPGNGGSVDDGTGGGNLGGGTDDDGTDNDSAGDSVTPDNGVHDSFAQQVVDLVNAERAKVGAAPLTLHKGAAGAAQVRAKELETSFSHTRPDGSSYSTALKQAGVSFMAAGENIAYGQQTPEQVMQSWMNSAGHRANILSETYTSIGVGHYESASGVHYWSQLFFK